MFASNSKQHVNGKTDIDTQNIHFWNDWNHKGLINKSTFFMEIQAKK